MLRRRSHIRTLSDITCVSGSISMSYRSLFLVVVIATAAASASAVSSTSSSMETTGIFALAAETSSNTIVNRDLLYRTSEGDFETVDATNGLKATGAGADDQCGSLTDRTEVTIKDPKTKEEVEVCDWVAEKKRKSRCRKKLKVKKSDENGVKKTIRINAWEYCACTCRDVDPPTPKVNDVSTPTPKPTTKKPTPKPTTKKPTAKPTTKPPTKSPTSSPVEGLFQKSTDEVQCPRVSGGPIDEINGSICDARDGYEEGHNCGYLYVWGGCTYDELTCQPKRECSCTDDSWTCRINSLYGNGQYFPCENDNVPPESGQPCELSDPKPEPPKACPEVSDWSALSGEVCDDRTGYRKGDVCEFDHVWTDCTYRSLSCRPSEACTCNGDIWVCIIYDHIGTNLYAECENDPDDIPPQSGDVCAPGDPKPEPPSDGAAVAEEVIGLRHRRLQ